jgi:RNA polymerase sigma-70 factor (ECF subfamily)
MRPAGTAGPRFGDTPAMASAAPQEQTPRPSDAELVARCLRGDRQGFHELVERYYRPVCGFILKRVQQPDLVEDLVQETFLEAYQALQTTGRPVQFAAWLFGIAHNRCGKWLRRKRPSLFSATEPPDVVAVPSFVDTHAELEEQQRLLQALDRSLADLPGQTQKLLHMKHHQGKTCEQIAAELGQPVGTVKSNLSRAYKALRARLGRCGDPQS